MLILSRNKKTVEQEINEFFDLLCKNDISEMLSHMFEVFILYDVDKDDDWVKNSIENKEESEQIRILRTVHLLSKMSDLYAGKFVLIKTKFPNLWLKMEEQAKKK